MTQNKPEITYPCEWHYRIIGTVEGPMRKAAESVALGKQYKLIASNQSSGGKYLSLQLTVLVENESERIAIFDALKNHPEIKMVL